MRALARRLRLVAIFALVALTAYTGIVDGIGTLQSASTLGERVTAALQLLYGACAVATVCAMLFKRGWVFPLLVAWAVALSVTGGLAAAVFGGTGAMVGAAAGASVAVVAGLVLWGWRRHAVGGQA